MTLDMHQCALKHIRPALAMAVAMESVDSLRQRCGQFVVGHAKPCSGSARVIQVGSHLTILRIHSQSETDIRSHLPCSICITLKLRERVEGDMAGATGDLVDLVIGVSRRESMRPGPELLESEAGLIERAGRRGLDILAEDGEGSPQGIGFESQDNLHVRLSGHVGYESKVVSKQRLLQNINRFLHDSGKNEQ